MGRDPSLEGQERPIGREKLSGAAERDDVLDPVDLDAREGGQPIIPTDAHIRLSSPEANGGQRILTRLLVLRAHRTRLGACRRRAIRSSTHSPRGG